MKHYYNLIILNAFRLHAGKIQLVTLHIELNMIHGHPAPNLDQKHRMANYHQYSESLNNT